MFCKLAEINKISSREIEHYIHAISSGASMTENDIRVGEFMAAENTFWNPCAYLDYNFYLDNRKEIASRI